MKVLVVVHGFPPLAGGGAEIYAHAHATTLARNFGDDVLIFTREQDPAAPEYRVRREHRDGVSVVWINNTFRSTRSFEESYRNPAIDAIARAVIDSFSPDVAHVHHLTCLSIGIIDALAARRVPIVFTLHDYWLMCHRGQLFDSNLRVCDGPETCHKCLGTTAGLSPRVRRTAPLARSIARALPARSSAMFGKSLAALTQAASNGDARSTEMNRRTGHMRRLIDKVAHFDAPSAYLRDRFLEFGVAPDRIERSGYGFDPDPFKNAQHAASNRLRIGYMGTLMVSKAPHVLLEAFRRLPANRATVDLIGGYAPYHGDDSYRTILNPLLRMPGVRAHGALPHARAIQALASLDVLVVTSMWPENSPLVIREAFLAGVPVVAPRIGGIPEIVEDGAGGLLYHAGDSDDLHRALSRILEEPNLLDQLRARIPAVRTIDDEVTSTRKTYARVIAAGRASSSPRDRICAVVLNYQTPDQTLLAVSSLRASRPPLDRILVVNNGPADRELERTLGPGVDVMHTGSNLGFAGGMNAGMRDALSSGATRVLLVNSDMTVPPDCVQQLSRMLDDDSGIGIVGPIVLSRSDPSRIASLGMEYSTRTGRVWQRGSGERIATLDDRSDHEDPIAGVSGCLMLIRREVFDAIGFLDEDYFLVFEDLDFCLRARSAGFASAMLKTARAYHEGGQSMRADASGELYFAARNHLLMARRADPQAGRLASAGRTAAIVTLNLAHALLRGGGSTPARVSAVLRGVRDYRRGRFGAQPTNAPPEQRQDQRGL